MPYQLLWLLYVTLWRRYYDGTWLWLYLKRIKNKFINLTMEIMKALFRILKNNYKEAAKKGMLTPSCMIPVNF